MSVHNYDAYFQHFLAYVLGVFSVDVQYCSCDYAYIYLVFDDVENI